MLQPTSKESGPNAQGLAVTVLPPGASRTLLFKGGPHPWVGKPSFFFSDGIERQKNNFLSIIPVLSPVEVEDETVVRAAMMEGIALPHHAAVVTCLKVSLSIITIIIITIIIITIIKSSPPACRWARPRWRWVWGTRSRPQTRSPASRREAFLCIVQHLPRSAKLR